jgi:hypothetical protein
MAAMDNFDHILHWKLKRGSHAFPGTDGGTCINEAAIVAAASPTSLCVPFTTCRGVSLVRFAPWRCS